LLLWLWQWIADGGLNDCVYIGYFKENILLHFIASMISGLITTAASMPVDIAKTRFVMSAVMVSYCFLQDDLELVMAWLTD